MRAMRATTLAASAVLVLLGLLSGTTVAHTIKHIVVLMEENRSFDHLFGWAGAELGINGLTGKEYNHVSSFNASSEKIYVTKDAPFIADCDPQHVLLLTTPKIFGVKDWLSHNLSQAAATMGGFIEVEHDIKSNHVRSRSGSTGARSFPTRTAARRRSRV